VTSAAGAAPNDVAEALSRAAGEGDGRARRSIDAQAPGVGANADRPRRRRGAQQDTPDGLAEDVVEAFDQVAE